jgi:hypothetical protein
LLRSAGSIRLDAILLDILACILLELEPSCHPAATRPRFARLRLAVLGLNPRRGLDPRGGLNPRRGLDPRRRLDSRRRLDPRRLDSRRGLDHPRRGLFAAERRLDLLVLDRAL